MNLKIAPGLAALACASSLSAHHSVSMIDVSRPVWVKGTVVRYQPISPHTMFELEQRAADGVVQRWTIEGPFPGRLQRILSVNGMRADEDFVRVGDIVEVCGFRPKRNPAADAGGGPPPYVHGHLLVMPDGRMESWGPYGKLDNCVRSSDKPETWLEFLSADPLGRELWCNSKKFANVASAAPSGFVAAVDAGLTQPCPPR